MTATSVLLAAALLVGQAGAAPELRGLGSLHMPVSTTVPRAQAFFDQGVRLLYAFNHAEARRAFRQAAQAYNQPSVWHQSPRLVLGAALLAAKRPADAEVEYRKDLARYRENGWALFGLWQSLAAQGRTAEARQVRARFRRAWAGADIDLTSSRIMAMPKVSGSGRR